MPVSLVSLGLNQKAKIISIDEGDILARMIEMGLYQGREISIVLKAPFGDPIAIEIEGSILSLRKSEASLIQVEAI